MRITLLVIFAAFVLSSCQQKNYVEDEQAVIKVLRDQEKNWNNGDLDGFMKGYWNSPELSFTGSKGVTKGWDNTNTNFKTAYASKDRMGELSFDIEAINRISDTAYHVIGQFTLIRAEDQPTGFFTLIIKKIDGHWYITSDHTCG